jgi:hypothetical protein
MLSTRRNVLERPRHKSIRSEVVGVKSGRSFCRVGDLGGESATEASSMEETKKPIEAVDR